MGRWLLWVVCLAVGLGCGGESVPTPTGCTCDGRVCGPNSCGQGSCGDCPTGDACYAGACRAPVVTDGGSATDGGTGAFGAPCQMLTDCSSGGLCVGSSTSAFCSRTCTDDCDCPIDYACNGRLSTGETICAPGTNRCGVDAGVGCSCDGRACGANSCGSGSCGTCLSGQTCSAMGQCATTPVTCQSGCGARQCGADPGPNCAGRTCGPTAGACPAGATCTAGQCACTPNCTGRTCGSNGCGGSCGACPRGFQCGGAGGCDVDPSSRWVLTVTTGTVATMAPGGGAWDPFGGAPDPQVCITINGTPACTPYASDTFSTTWNVALPATTAGALQAGVATQYLDYDSGTANDRICGDTTLAINRATFLAGGSSVGCAAGQWSFTLRAQ